MDPIIHMAVERGLHAWRAKPHNATWWRQIDGTPIPNDLCVCIAESVTAARTIIAMSEAATVCKQAERIAELEAALIALAQQSSEMVERLDTVFNAEAEAISRALKLVNVE